MTSQLAREPQRSEGGYILITAMALVTILLGVGLAFMRWSTDEAMQSRQTSGAMQAYYLGQMGVVERGFIWLKSQLATALPESEISLAGRTVPGVGLYRNVEISRLSSFNGDFGARNTVFRITAVGVVKAPWNDGQGTKDIERKAVLYVSIRNFVDYMYLSDKELTSFGDVIKFWHEDTLNGRVHSNDQIAIMENPVFYDQVTQASDDNDFWLGAGYNPQFLGPDPIFHAAPVLIPPIAERLRDNAQFYFNPGEGLQMRAILHESTADMYTWEEGEAFDPLSVDPPVPVPIDQGPLGTCIFTETALELEGRDVSGKLTIGSAKLVRLVNDVRIAGPSSGQPEFRIDSSNTNFIGIVSEGDIKIANTPANGRNNSDNLGFSQNNPEKTDIVITAAVVALGNPETESEGSFTFENQNDDDSTFDGPTPDYRGTIYLFGSLTQSRRGYVHRSNNNSTGYGKQYRYDKRFLRIRPPCFFDAVDSSGHALFNVVQWGQGQERAWTTPGYTLTRYN